MKKPLLTTVLGFVAILVPALGIAINGKIRQTLVDAEQARNDLADAESEKQELLSALEDVRASVKSELNGWEAERNTLETKLNAAEADSDSLRDELSAAKSELKTSQAQITSLALDVGRWQKEASDAVNDKVRMADELKNLADRRDRLNAMLAEQKDSRTIRDLSFHLVELSQELRPNDAARKSHVIGLLFTIRRIEARYSVVNSLVFPKDFQSRMRELVETLQSEGDPKPLIYETYRGVKKILEKASGGALPSFDVVSETLDEKAKEEIAHTITESVSFNESKLNGQTVEGKLEACEESCDLSRRVAYLLFPYFKEFRSADNLQLLVRLEKALAKEREFLEMLAVESSDPGDREHVKRVLVSVNRRIEILNALMNGVYSVLPGIVSPAIENSQWVSDAN